MTKSSLSNNCFGAAQPRVVQLSRGRIAAVGALWLAAVVAVAALGGMATASSVGTWYTTIAKPSWNPPSWLFGPVWSLLYLMMAVAASLVHLTGEGTARRNALTLFVVQLALNGLWSWCFFAARSPLLGLIDIAALLVALFLTMLAFLRVSCAAMFLLVPYFLWVSFAAILNGTIWWLNR